MWVDNLSWEKEDFPLESYFFYNNKMQTNNSLNYQMSEETMKAIE